MIKYIVSLLILGFYIPIFANASYSIKVDKQIPPYSFIIDDQQATGFTIDVLSAILNSKSEFNYIEKISSKNIENSIYGFIPKELIPEGFTFIEIPHVYEYFVFSRKNSSIESLKDLKGKKIILKKNDLPSLNFNEENEHVTYVNTYEKALELLASGINECAIVPFHVGKYYIQKKQYENIDYVLTPFSSKQVGFGIHPSNVELIKVIETNLQLLIENGSFKQIESKWFIGRQYDKEVHFAGKYVFIIIIVVLTIAILILFIWNRFLVREIGLSTENHINEIINQGTSPMVIDFFDVNSYKVLRQTPIWLFVNDIKGNLTFATEDFLYYALDKKTSTQNLTLSDIFEPKEVERIQALESSSLGGKNQLLVESVCIRIGDKNHDLKLLKYPVQVKGKIGISYVNVILKPLAQGDSNLRNISPEFLFKAIIDTIPDVIFFKNLRGEYIGGNKAFYEFSGKDEFEMVGKTDFDLFDKKRADKYRKTDDIVYKSGIIWEGRAWEDLPDGATAKFETKKLPLYDKKNKIFGLIGLSHNITNQFNYEQELASAKERAEESDRIKSSFMANMSHEIRNPMNSIIGFSDLLADPDLTIDQRIEIIELIQSNGHMLIDLIDDIIDFSRIEAGQIHLKYIDFNLNSVMKDAFSYGKSKLTQLNKEHLNLAYDIGAYNDEFMIHTDPFRLKQIINNLLNASIKFSTADSLFLGYIVDNEDLIFYIKNDNNIIANDLFTKLAENSLANTINFSEIEESVGISLIIAKKVVEMIGGKFWIEDASSGKANYYFTIDCKKVERTVKKVSDNNSFEAPDWSGKTILVAEDEETNFILLDGVLSRTNCTLIRAENGKEAIEKFKEYDKIDLILMDIRMPEINGVEASRKILDYNPDAKIIAQTAYAMPEDKEQYFNIGMKGVLAKPIDPSELYFLCNKNLGL